MAGNSSLAGDFPVFSPRRVPGDAPQLSSIDRPPQPAWRSSQQLGVDGSAVILAARVFQGLTIALIRTGWDRNFLLMLAITLHNIPEGLAVGVAFGAAAQGLPAASQSAAVALAVGISIQNFPEGLAISLPLRREGASLWKSFSYGQASALVEPVAATFGAAVVMVAQPVLPYALSFAAGAMIFVVVEVLIPESHRSQNHDLATLGALVGFVVMMVLDVAFR